MTAAHYEQCRSCGKPIQWAITANGKALPVDAFPDADRGNVSLYPNGGKLRAVVVPPRKAAAMRARHCALYLSHFVTCPQSKQWRHRVGPGAA